jgi:hypothetical protein
MATGVTKIWTRRRLLVVVGLAPVSAVAVVYAVHANSEPSFRGGDRDYGRAPMVADMIRKEIEGRSWSEFRRILHYMWPDIVVVVSDSTIRVVNLGDDKVLGTDDDQVVEVPMPK